MRILPFFLFIGTIVVTLLLPMQTAQAWGNYGHYGHGQHRYGHSGYGHYARKHHYYPYSRSYSRHSSRHSSRHYNRGRDCHSVYKHQKDEYGSKAKINGTKCYDEYGNGYVVPGSRYLADEDVDDYEN